VDAQTLLESVENDFRKGKVANMMKTQEGRALLQRPFDKLRAQMAPVITRADAILKESGPWVLNDTTPLKNAGIAPAFQITPPLETQLGGSELEEFDIAKIFDCEA
jgi:hypothetical protein